MFKNLRNNYWRKQNSAFKLCVRIAILIFIIFLIDYFKIK